MASIYRPTYTRPIPAGAEILTRRGKRVARFKDAKGRLQTVPLTEDGARLRHQYRCWYIAYMDADGVRRVARGFTDREATEEKARELERQAARRKAGLLSVDPAKADTPLAEALDLYLADLERAGRDDTYRYIVGKRLEKLARECPWPTLAAVRSDGLSRWLSGAAREGKAGRTLNQYIDTARGFLSWCVDQRYLEGNPLAAVRRSDERDKRRVRRALTLDELRRLLDVAGDRHLVYLTAMLTGLRRDELGKLQWGDVALGPDCPHIRLRIPANKSRRADSVPLPPELVEHLAAARPAEASGSAGVFRSVPDIKTYKRDLAAAGIEYKDEQGRQADFHALRVSYCTILAGEGVSVRVAMELMRHTDIRLTTRVYTDPKLLDMAGAVENLPRLTGRKEAEGRAERA